MVNLDTSISLLAPYNIKKLVPVTANTPVDALYVAEVIVGTETLLTVTPLPVRSAITTAASAPAFQSSIAYRLYVIPLVDEVPFLFTHLLIKFLSVAFRVAEKEVPLVISTDEELLKINVLQSECMPILDTSISLLAPLNFKNPVPVTTNTPVDTSYVAEVIVGTDTLLTVMPLPVRSAITIAASAPAFQSSAAARLYVVAPVDDVPFLFNN